MNRYADMTLWQLRQEAAEIEREIRSRYEWLGIEIVEDSTLAADTIELVHGPHRVRITGVKP